MIRLYDEGKNHICLCAEEDEDKKVLENLKDYLPVVMEDSKDKSFEIIVRKSKRK